MRTLQKSESEVGERTLDSLAEILFISSPGLPAQHLIDHLGPRFRCAVIEDPEQMRAAMRWRHALPLLGGLRILSKSQLHDWGQLALGFHDLHQPFGKPLRPALSGV